MFFDPIGKNSVVLLFYDQQQRNSIIIDRLNQIESIMYKLNIDKTEEYLYFV